MHVHMSFMKAYVEGCDLPFLSFMNHIPMSATYITLITPTYVRTCIHKQALNNVLRYIRMYITSWPSHFYRVYRLYMMTILISLHVTKRVYLHVRTYIRTWFMLLGMFLYDLYEPSQCCFTAPITPMCIIV